MKDIIPGDLLQLKHQVLSRAKLTTVSEESCEAIKTIIELKTGRSLSILAIKKFFGYVPTKFGPSYYTLDMLSRYCGYLNWDDFVTEINFYISIRK